LISYKSAEPESEKCSESDNKNAAYGIPKLAWPMIIDRDGVESHMFKLSAIINWPALQELSKIQQQVCMQQDSSNKRYSCSIRSAPSDIYTQLPSNLRPTTRECVHLITRNNFRSRDKDGGHTVRSAIAENPLLHANFTSSFLQNWSYCRSKFYILRE